MSEIEDTLGSNWEQHDFYRILQVDPDAGTSEIERSHKELISELDPNAKPDDQKKAAALAFVAIEAAYTTLADEKSRKSYNKKHKEMKKAESAREKIESKRQGNLQEEQSIEEDEKFKKVIQRHESAENAIVDFYYDRVLTAAGESRFNSIPPEQVVKWLSSQREESARKSEQKGRRLSYQIDWDGFPSVQESRKGRSKEILHFIDELMETFQAP